MDCTREHLLRKGMYAVCIIIKMQYKCIVPHTSLAIRLRGSCALVSCVTQLRVKSIKKEHFWTWLILNVCALIMCNAYIYFCIYVTAMNRRLQFIVVIVRQTRFHPTCKQTSAIYTWDCKLHYKILHVCCLLKTNFVEKLCPIDLHIFELKTPLPLHYSKSARRQIYLHRPRAWYKWKFAIRNTNNSNGEKRYEKFDVKLLIT